MPSITSDLLYAVAAELGLRVERFETTRAADADSVGNGNWLAWDGDHTYVLRRYHVPRTEEDLAYESDVLRHLTARTWSVPTPVAGPIRYDERLWAVTRFVPGRPRETETSDQIEERGSLLARLHADLGNLDKGQRQGFYQGCDLEAMGAFQDWDPGVAALRELRPDLAEWACVAMAAAQRSVAKGNLLDPAAARSVPREHGDGGALDRATDRDLRSGHDRTAAGTDRDAATVGSGRAFDCRTGLSCRDSAWNRAASLGG